MRTLALLHRWVGGIVGLLLAVIGLSGAILVWEDSWIGVPGADEPLRAQVADFARALDAANAAGPGLTRLTFAGEDFGLHQAAYADGSGAYLNQSGELVARWTSQWDRPELWLFDLHHHLFLAEVGKTATGILGLAGLLFVVSGAILWWRARRTFRLRPWPARLTRSAIVRQHRDIGIVAAPLLLILTATGSLMVFDGLSDAVLAPWRDDPAAQRSIDVTAERSRTIAADSWQAALSAAQQQFPHAAFRRVQFPKDGGAPLVLRMKQPADWTPNGRTYVRFDPVTWQVIGIDDPLEGDIARSIEEKFYPLHAAKVGGAAWKIAVSLAGVVLAMLGLLASYSFWFRGGLRQSAA